jgi:hypothetical protein
MAGIGNFKHGFSDTPIYEVYKKIKSRCHNKSNKDFKHYGARGIVMCLEWFDNPESFCTWAMNNNYHKGLTIERLDNNKGYSPSNCTFVNRFIQNNNTRANRYVQYKEETLTMSQFCRKYNLDYSIFAQRARSPKFLLEKDILNCGTFSSVKPYIKKSDNNRYGNRKAM